MNQVSNIGGGEKLEEFKKDFESEGFEKEDFAESSTSSAVTLLLCHD